MVFLQDRTALGKVHRAGSFHSLNRVLRTFHDARTVPKGIRLKGGVLRQQRDLLQGDAVPECARLDLLHTGRDRDFFQSTAVFECGFSNFLQSL